MLILTHIVFSCEKKKYLKHLPTASIIIVFIDEYPSVLLRTLHSVINRSPEQLIHEIIFVDDGSVNENVGKEFEEEVTRKFPKLKFIRRAQRDGLIAARMSGAKVATGDVLLFLDSHCETTVNWLPPLLGKSLPHFIKNKFKELYPYRSDCEKLPNCPLSCN